MPKKAARKATLLPPKTQPHTRFNAKRITPLVSVSDQAQTLIDNSVAKSTLSTYKSAQRTILKFLAATRNLPLEDLDLISITPDEFMHFLASLKDQGISSTHTYRAALAHAQKSAQIPTWAKDQQTVALATGARGHHTAADKGVLTPDQVCELLHLVLNSPHPFTAPCKNCWPALHQNPALFNVVLADAIKLQWLARLRPGELSLLRRTDLVATLETINARSTLEPPISVVVNQLNFTARRKNGVGRYVISDDAALQFRKLAFYLPEQEFLLPPCTPTHIGQALRLAAEQLKWNPDLVWVAHGLRHSVFTSLEDNLKKVVDQWIAGVSSGVLRGTYIHPLD